MIVYFFTALFGGLIFLFFEYFRLFELFETLLQINAPPLITIVIILGLDLFILKYFKDEFYKLLRSREWPSESAKKISIPFFSIVLLVIT